MNPLNSKCPNCGAPIKYNEDTKKWECIYCGSKYSLEEMEKYDSINFKSNLTIETAQGLRKRLEQLNLYQCTNCGSKVMGDDLTSLNACIYCGSENITKTKTNDGVAPTKLIPFKISEEEALKKFEELAKNKPLLPQLFYNIDNTERITGVYIPFWVYDFDISGKMSFIATDTTTWSKGFYKYEKIDRYSSRKEGQMSFKEIPSVATSYIDANLIDLLEPYNYNEFVDYNHVYTSGHLIEMYNTESNQNIERTKNRAIEAASEIMNDSVKHQVKNIDKKEFTAKKTHEDYVLLPIWLANVKYKGKIYTFAMNGQTGKIATNLEPNKRKIITIASIVFIIIFFITFLIVL